MNRLSVRLAVAMVAAVVSALFIMSATQRIAELRAYQLLPDQVREVVPPPRLWPLWLKTRGAPPPGPVRDPGAVGGPPDDRLALNFLATRNYQRESFLGGAALATLLTILFALWLSRLIAKPLEEVSKAATAVASGDLAVRVPRTRALERSSLETTRLAQDFNSMAAALESYEGERKAMIADIAHELRTPLTAMRLRLQALEDGLLTFEPSEVASLNRSAELLSRLVEDLRTLSLADGGRLQLRMGEHDLGELVAVAVELQRPGFDRKGVRLEFAGSDAALPVVVDRDRITQVIGNLLDNALRVTEEGGGVSVAVGAGTHVRSGDLPLPATSIPALDRTTTGSDRWFTISDTGPGLSAASLDRAFDRYFQDDRDTRGGSGLGLAIVDALVRLHGGTVGASNYEAGARFMVRLPRNGAVTPP
ncbi:MAG TPA: ATP-binding protein [Trueperaceae bacterium]|nr:ATP-binding protein [Trueperaceae bacterium]